MNQDLKAKAVAKIKEKNLLDSSQKYLVSFSGGPDSCFLLEVLKEIIPKNQIFIVYFNHNLRTSADKEEEFIRNLIKEQQLQGFIELFDVKKSAKELKESAETTARILRKQALINYATKLSINKIITAHHFDDICETFIHRLIRGSKSNLSPFQPITEYQNNLFFIKPLIYFSKKEILEYLSDNKIDYIIDETNFDNIYTRNSIRNEILPIFSKINHQYKKNFRELFTYLNEQREFIASLTTPILAKSQITNDGIKIKSKHLINAPVFLQKQVLFELANRFTKNQFQIESKLIEKIITYIKIKKNGKIQMAKNKFVKISPDEIIFYKKIISSLVNFNYELASIPEEIEIQENKKKIIFTLGVKRGEAPRGLRGLAPLFLDFDKIKNHKLVIRNRKPGDKFTPFNCQYKKSVKEFMIDRKIPQSERDSIPILLCDNQIIAILGIEIADFVKVSDKTKNIIMLDIVGTA